MTGEGIYEKIAEKIVSIEVFELLLAEYLFSKIAPVFGLTLGQTQWIAILIAIVVGARHIVRHVRTFITWWRSRKNGKK